MKTISLDQLRRESITRPQLWHDALIQGKLLRGVSIEIPDDFPIQPDPPKEKIPRPFRVLKQNLIDRSKTPPVAPAKEWPLLIKWIAKHRQSPDIGAGDTLARLFTLLGADRATRLYERLTGKTCGCTDRKAWLNARYPYPNASPAGH